MICPHQRLLYVKRKKQTNMNDDINTNTNTNTHKHTNIDAAPVISTQANANISKIDPTQALSLPGVVKFYSANDIDPTINAQG